MSDDNKM
jgi:glycerol uptake facilitator-like aquaporin